MHQFIWRNCASLFRKPLAPQLWYSQFVIFVIAGLVIFGLVEAGFVNALTMTFGLPTN
jgi:hypothetical protein